MKKLFIKIIRFFGFEIIDPPPVYRRDAHAENPVFHVLDLSALEVDAGVYNIKWTGVSNNGSPLPSGMYFYEMKTEDYQAVKKLVLVK